MGIHNILNYQGPEKKVILCADNDDHKSNSRTLKIITKTQDHFVSQRKSVSIIKPSHAGDDFNDVLKKEGVKGVREYVREYQDPTAQKAISNLEGSSMSTAHLPRIKVSDTKTVDQQETLFKYIESKIKEIKTFKGSSLANQAKEELKVYIKVFEKNEDMMEKLKIHDQEITKEIQNFMKSQMRNKEKGL